VKNPLDELDLSPREPRSGRSAAQAMLDLEPAETAPEIDLPDSEPLVDLPLGGAATAAAVAAPAPVPAGPVEVLEVEPPREGTAPLRSRIGALAADIAFVLLLTAAPLLAATAGPARSLAPDGLWFTGAFAIYLSFFATVIPLALFGKTIGMALTGLTARGDSEAPLTMSESSRRWLGTLIALAGLGVPLLIGREPGLPSMADRLAGRPLEFEEV
jgi:hypothetical protein